MIQHKMRISYLQWIYTFLIISILWLGTIFTLNFIIDPFGNRNWIVTKKYKPILHERSEKYNTIFYQNNIQKYDCLILGSSRVMSIVPSSHLSTKECYNFGIHVANNPEKLFILQEWIKYAPLKTVYIGNELYNVHSKTRPNYLNPNGFTNGAEGNYLSIYTLNISIKTLMNMIKDEPQSYFNENGSINHYIDEESIEKGRFNHSYKHFTDISQEAVKENFIQNPFTYENHALDSLKKIKALCDKHHVRVYAFITPTFYESQKEIQTFPLLKAASQKFRNDLIKIFGEIYDFDVNSPENRNPTNFYDSVHYRPVIGTLMIDRMQGKNRYGNVLNDNID